ncbi:MAG: YihY/virulence factor BrkB family protein [Gemmatimonadales bacterium]
MRLPGTLRIVRTAFSAWQADHVPRRGAALAYYTLFAIGPVLLIAIAVAGTIFGPQAARGEIVGQIDQLIGPAGAEIVQTVLARAGPESGSIQATIVGIAAFLLAASGAFLELQSALNRIWRVKPRPTKKKKIVGAIVGFLLKRLRSFGIVVSIGFVLIVSLAVSAGLNAMDDWIAQRVPAGPQLLAAVNLIISVGVITLLFAAVYRILPDVRLRWGDVWTGAVITALLFTLGKELIGLYLGRSATASTFGAAGSIVVLLLWVYYSAQIALFGAEVSRVYLRSRQARSTIHLIAMAGRGGGRTTVVK